MVSKPANHPFVPFKQIFKNLAAENIGSTIRQKVFLSLCDLWYSASGVSVPEERIRDRFARGENGYWTQYKSRESLYYPESSATCILNHQNEEDPVLVASKLIISTLRFRHRSLNNQFELEFESNKPLDMLRYGLLFSRITIARRDGKNLLFEIIETPPSDHIIVAIDGLFYKLQVLKNNQVVSASCIFNQITHIVADARLQFNKVESDRFPFGLLTVIQNQKTISLYEKLQGKCRATIEDINNALFFVAIDLHDCPRSLEKLGRVIHFQNAHSRDYRRSLQLVVTGNGHVGIIGEPNAGLGGSFAAKLLDDFSKESSDIEKELGASPTPEVLFRRLKFDVDMLTEHENDFGEIERQVHAQTFSSGHNTVFCLEGIGKKDFSQLGASADGAFHAALHLAFKRCFGFIPDVGNFVSLRSIQHGEIFRYNSTTSDMRKFTDEPNSDNLIKALHEHKELVKKIKRGTDDFYQASMMLLTMNNTNEISFLGSLSIYLILNFFIDNFVRRFVNQNMLVSHIQEFPGVALLGRPGIKLSFLEKPAVAGHYMMFDNHIMICFVSNPGQPSHAGQVRKLITLLHESLAEVRQLLKTRGS